MPATYRNLPKVRLVLCVPPELEEMVREAAHKSRKSHSEIGATALAQAFGVSPESLGLAPLPALPPGTPIGA
jgi:hypothetical protein